MAENNHEIHSLTGDLRGPLPEISLDEAYLEGLIGRIVEDKLAEGPIEAECDHLGMRAEVMCRVIQSHAQIESADALVKHNGFDADKIVDDFKKIWRAIEG